MKTIGIIGPGLIGGSMAIDLRKRGYASEVLGVEKESLNASAALQMGIIDESVSLEECARRADIVIIAVPVSAACTILPRVLNIFACQPERKQIVMDTCSTKGGIVLAAAGHPMCHRFVASHPMAGTEYSGPWAAQPSLFDGRACIIANPQESDADAVKEVENLYDQLNMRVIEMDAAAHDVHTAYISHISHVTSFALALTVLDKEKDEKHIFDLASGGFASTVRLAKSNADMWVPILKENRQNVLQVIDTYINKMQQFRDAICDNDADAIRALIEEGNKIKRILR